MTPSKLLGNRALGVERKPHLSLLSWLEAMYINEPSNWPTLFGYELANLLLSFRNVFRNLSGSQPAAGRSQSIDHRDDLFLRGLGCGSALRASGNNPVLQRMECGAMTLQESAVDPERPASVLFGQ
jgi:hypothetical protein